MMDKVPEKMTVS